MTSLRLRSRTCAPRRLELSSFTDHKCTLLVLALLAACDAPRDVAVADAAVTDAGVIDSSVIDAAIGDAAIVPDASWVHDAATPPFIDGNFGHVVYLNFGGGVIDYGWSDDSPHDVSNISSLGTTSVVPPFIEDIGLNATRTTRADVIASIASHVAEAYAPFDVQVVTARPPIAHFSMIVIGGEMTDIGQSIGPLGIAATENCGTPSDLDNGFIATGANERYTMVADATKAIAHNAVHEAGHIFGLVHNTDAQGTYMMTGGTDDAWGSGPVDPIGSQGCPRTTQDDVTVLTTNIGLHTTRDPVPPPPDTTPPVISVDSLTNGMMIGSSYQPCVHASDDTEVMTVVMQVIIQTDTGPGILQQDHREAPPYQFAPINPVGGNFYVRFVAVDKWDNIAEQRVTPTFGASGPPSPACH
jgi:hypothetical protein